MANRYTSYFDKLPQIKYDINRAPINAKYVNVTNIFFRIRFIQEVINNIDSYFIGEIEEGETPEIVAEKVYGDGGAAWMILVANQIVDPQWEWPLTYGDFQKYIAGKYGSLEAAQTQVHHYEMVIKRELKPDNVITERRYVINEKNLTDNNLSVPYYYYFNYYFPPVYLDKTLADTTLVTVDSTLPKYTVDSGYESQTGYGLQPGSLAFTQYYNTYDIEGKTVIETVNGEAINTYDWENDLNEKRRFIKIIKKDYYQRILNEFDTLTKTEVSYKRRVI